jgi:hypothetical protein
MTITKIEKSFTRKYAPMVLWWDDVVEIFNRAKGLAKSVELSNADYKFETLEAAKDHLGSTPQSGIKIGSSSPYMSIDGGRFHVAPGERSAQLFLEIDEILSRRQRRPTWAYSSWMIVPIFALGGINFVVPGNYWKMGLLAVQIMSCMWYLRATFIDTKRGLVIHMQRRSEARGFFQRNKDQLILFIITAIVSGLLGFAGGQIKDKYFPANTTSKPAS